MRSPTVTDAMVNAAVARAEDMACLPFEVKAHHFGSLAGGWTEGQVTALREAQAAAARRNRKYMRDLLEAALAARNERETVTGSSA